ncbi:MAG TPA: hypothetical protein VFQ39_03495, partial [Longimicrobium sp.]|nr:hypothetical protein [Longimicrobium sp.]
SASIADSLLYVHFGGVTKNSKRLVDIYGIGDAGYRGTLLLAGPVSQVAVAGGRIYTLQRDSVTILTALRFTPR